MSFDLAAIYASTLKSLRAGQRGLRRYSGPEVSGLLTALASPDPTLCHQALVLLAHSSHPVREFESLLLNLMQQPLPTEDLVWLMDGARRHIIQGRFLAGERLPHEFLSQLRVLLHHPDRQVVEWALRTVDECGAQGIVFRQELAKIKPAIWTLWKQQNRTVLELVLFLERRWSAHEKAR